jgi:hypothetical protein
MTGNMSKRIFFFFIFSLIATTLACDLPALSAPSDTAPLDPNMLPTIIAGTANAAATQTALVATNTPLPTSTATPVPTQSLVFSAFDTAVSQQADGSTLFIDRAASYQFVAPAGWTLFRPNEPEYFKLWTLPIASDTTVQKLLTNAQNASPDIFRVMGVDLRDGHIRPDFIINFDVQWNRTVEGSYDKVFDAVKQTYSNLSTTMSYKTLSSNVVTTPQGLEAGIMEFDITLKTQLSEKKVYEKQIILKTKAGYYFIRFDTTYDFKDLTLPEFEQVLASLKAHTQ